MNWLKWFIDNPVLTFVCLAVFLIIVLTIFILIKLSTKNVKVILSLFIKIPSYINEAESKGFKTGESKLNYVLHLCLNYLIITTKCSTKKAVTQYSDLLSSYIEEVLSTPQKKGVSKDEI